MNLERNVAGRLEKFLSYFPVVAVQGARQCGKTTLCKNLRPDWKYLDLEKESDFDYLTGDFDFFFKNNPAGVIFDEAQLSPQLFRELRGVVDENRGLRGRFIITGSSSPELVANLNESLAGRIGVVELGTLTLNERYRLPVSDFLQTLVNHPVSGHLERFEKLDLRLRHEQVMEHFLHGGYPEPVMHEDPSFFTPWMENYRQSYINRDIRQLFPRLDARNYSRFLSMLGELSGTIINRAEIGRSLNISETSVRDYLDIAAGTYVWRNVTSLERTVSKSTVKMPRGYIRDSGLLHHMKNIRSVEHLYRNPGTGAAFEALIIEEIIKNIQSLESAPWKFSYYRTRNGAEVDLILETPEGERIPVEIKFGATIRRADLRSLSALIEQEKCPYGIVINNSDDVRLLTENIIQIPAGCF
jgi:hypothetical protein